MPSVAASEDAGSSNLDPLRLAQFELRNLYFSCKNLCGLYPELLSSYG